MSTCTVPVQAFETREAVNVALADAVADTLRMAIDAKGKASLMVSGGSTPAAAYERLSEADLDWGAVTIGLVDERWVELFDPGSNEAMLRQTLLKARAAAATFLSMKTPDQSPFIATAEVSERYEPALQFDAVVLGMGLDGHTASWFPGAMGLAHALDPANEAVVGPIDASGAPVAGDHPLRMTLTASAIASARAGFLLMFGDDKRAVFDAALEAESDAPIALAASLLGDRLSVYWTSEQWRV